MVETSLVPFIVVLLLPLLRQGIEKLLARAAIAGQVAIGLESVRVEIAAPRDAARDKRIDCVAYRIAATPVAVPELVPTVMDR
jgi:hypothetical protein